MKAQIQIFAATLAVAGIVVAGAVYHPTWLLWVLGAVTVVAVWGWAGMIARLK